MGKLFVQIWYRFQNLIFPPKCILCQKILTAEETDLCTECRVHSPYFTVSKKKIANVADWTSIWFYKDHARDSVLRYKFGGRRHYAKTYGRLLAMKILTEVDEEFDLVTWVPVSRRRPVISKKLMGLHSFRVTGREDRKSPPR